MARARSRSTWPGVPALALPVPTSGALPASLQLIGPRAARRCSWRRGSRSSRAFHAL